MKVMDQLSTKQDSHKGSAAPAQSRDNPVVAPVPRVLIVEDEMLFAVHLETMVGALGLEVCGISPDGEGAVEQASDFDPALVLMDISLSGEIDGIEAARRIREKRKVSVIFITAYGDAQTIARIHEVVPDAQVLAKPVSPERLRNAVNKVIPISR